MTSFVNFYWNDKGTFRLGSSFVSLHLPGFTLNLWHLIASEWFKPSGGQLINKQKVYLKVSWGEFKMTNPELLLNLCPHLPPSNLVDVQNFFSRSLILKTPRITACSGCRRLRCLVSRSDWSTANNWPWADPWVARVSEELIVLNLIPVERS